MNTYFIKRFIARTAVVLSAAALFCGCSDDDETSTLHFDKPEVVIGPESSTASFILRSDTSWKTPQRRGLVHTQPDEGRQKRPR